MVLLGQEEKETDSERSVGGLCLESYRASRHAMRRQVRKVGKRARFPIPEEAMELHFEGVFTGYVCE